MQTYQATGSTAPTFFTVLSEQEYKDLQQRRQAALSTPKMEIPLSEMAEDDRIELARRLRNQLQITDSLIWQRCHLMTLLSELYAGLLGDAPSA